MIGRKIQKLFSFLFILAGAWFLLSPLLAQAAPLSFKNRLTRAEWVKFGVNPWRLDTDNDGYADDWEVSHGYCPTSEVYGLKLGPLCRLGTIDWRGEKYHPPANLRDTYPRDLVSPADCSALADRPAEPSASPSMETELISEPKIGNREVVSGDFLYAVRGETLSVFRVAPFAAARRVVSERLNFSPSTAALFGEYLILSGVTTHETAADIEPVSVVEVWSIRRPERPFFVRRLFLKANILALTLSDRTLYLAARSASAILSGAIQNTLRSVGPPNFKDWSRCSATQAVTPATSQDNTHLISWPLAAERPEPVIKTYLGLGEPAGFFGQDLYFVSKSNGWRAPAESEQTSLTKFQARRGQWNLLARQTIPGSVVSLQATSRQAVVLTDVAFKQAERNGLFVLDQDLNRVGWYQGFGWGETWQEIIWLGERVAARSSSSAPWYLVDFSRRETPRPFGPLPTTAGFNQFVPLRNNYYVALNQASVLAATTTATSSVSNPSITANLTLLAWRDPRYPLERNSVVIGPEQNVISLVANSSVVTVGETRLKAYRVTLERGFELRGEIALDKPATLGLQYSSRLLQARSLWVEITSGGLVTVYGNKYFSPSKILN